MRDGGGGGIKQKHDWRVAMNENEKTKSKKERETVCK